MCKCLSSDQKNCLMLTWTEKSSPTVMINTRYLFTAGVLDQKITFNTYFSVESSKYDDRKLQFDVKFFTQNVQYPT